MLPRLSHIRALLLSGALLLVGACGGGDGGGEPGSASANPGIGGSGTGSATLSWLPPAEHTDGTTVSGLAGYRVYAGRSQGSLALARTISNPGVTTVVFDGLASGTHYFAVSAYLTTGAESDRSSIGSKSIP